MEKWLERFRRSRSGFGWLLTIVLAFVIGYWFAGSEPLETTAGDSPVAVTHSREGIKYACPMNCVPPSDEPGKCPECGMELMETIVNPEEGVQYVCPMMCVPPVEKPGKCPVCGMDLAPASRPTKESHEKVPALELSPEAVRLAEIRTAPVTRKFVTTDVRLFGKIEYDPVELYKVSAFAPGVIDRIYVQRAGQAVRSGDPLFDMHSSDLFYMEQELAEVLKDLPYRQGLFPTKGQRMRRYMRPPSVSSFVRPEQTDDPEKQAKQKAAWDKYEQIRRKLSLLGLDEEAIDLVIARGNPTGISTVTTPTTGIVIEQNAFKGQYVNTGDTVFTIGNPSYMWARLEAYESDFGWLRIGQEARFETDAYPGETFRGRIQYLDPEFEPDSRTFTVGVLYTDPKSRLKPNMLVRGVVHARMTADGVGIPGGTSRERAPLVIPDSAPLLTGERAVVYVADPEKPGVYRGRQIVLGPRAKDYYVVRSGLAKGELVVVNGAFKIDSALQIMAESSMMGHDGSQGSAVAHHFHGGTAVMPASMTFPDEAQIDERRQASSAGASYRGRGYDERLKELMERRKQLRSRPE